MSQAKSMTKKYTCQDYLHWPDDERWEIIDGVAYNMTPAPSVKHQRIVGNFHINLKTNPNNPCFTGISPIDVVFDEYNVVQPDIFLVCDKTKITQENIKGAPDLIIEVTSPSTSLKDRREKKKLYEKFGVKEYLIVYPDEELVERFLIENDKYGAPEVFNWDETMRIESLDLDVDLWEIFEKEREEKEEAPAKP